jgi:hypothetical protein
MRNNQYIEYTPLIVRMSCCKSNNCAMYTGTSSRVLQQKNVSNFLLCTNTTTLNSQLENINNNQDQINQQLTSQLQTYGKDRNNKYYRPPPPFIPPSVLQLARETANVGVSRTIVEPCSGK